MKQGSKTTKKRVLMALSGGIDSAVSTHLLIKAGYEVEAAFMKNWSSTAGLKYSDCPWLTDRQDALRVAAHFGIPMHTVNYEKQYKNTVMDYFFKEYKAGRTPNPDVMCNKEIKFKVLYNWARKQGFDYIATGHYAQVKKVKTKQGSGGRQTVIMSAVKDLIKDSSASSAQNLTRFRRTSPQNDSKYIYQLVRSKDEFKDQTYFIYNIQQSQLPYLLFPIGSLKKSEVRALAKKLKLPNANKKESMGLCFVGQIRLKDFLEQKLKVKSGPIVDMNGTKIGEHQGLAFYTIGQRQGINVGKDGPWFVVSKNLKTNTLTATNNPNDPALQTKQVEIHSVNWITPPAQFPAKLTGRFRHQGSLEKLTITKQGRGQYLVEFAKSQKAVASGQSLVLYDGKVCVGGGVIV
jgi:tRNA-specific 2-thiouridylase